MKLVEPVGHAPVVRGLWRAAAQGRLSHALCFEGLAGSGRFVAALWFVQGLLCEHGPVRTRESRDDFSPCGVCRACKQLGSGGEGGNHSDVFVLDRAREQRESEGHSGLYQGSEITVAHIAARDGDTGKGLPSDPIAEFLRLRPLEGGARCVVIREAERMNASAQNAFLKTLEEPSPGTHLILECSRTARLLPTIRSRVVRVGFDPLTEPQVREVLAGLDEPEAHLDRWAALAEGAPGAALERIQRGVPALDAKLVAWMAGELPPGVAVRELWEVEGEFPGGTALARERERVATILERGIALLRSALHGAVAGLPGLGWLDAADAQRLQALAARVGPVGLEARLERFLELSRDLSRNLDPGLVLDRAIHAPTLGQLA